MRTAEPSQCSQSRIDQRAYGSPTECWCSTMDDWFMCAQAAMTLRENSRIVVKRSVARAPRWLRMIFIWALSHEMRTWNHNSHNDTVT